MEGSNRLPADLISNSHQLFLTEAFTAAGTSMATKRPPQNRLCVALLSGIALASVMEDQSYIVD